MDSGAPPALIEPGDTRRIDDQRRRVTGSGVGEGALVAIEDRADDRCARRTLDRRRERVESIEHRGRISAFEDHRPCRAAQLGHDRRCFEAVADAVADDEAALLVADVDDVIPVAADGETADCGQVPRGDRRKIADGFQHRGLQRVADPTVFADLDRPSVGAIQGAGDHVRDQRQERSVARVEWPLGTQRHHHRPPHTTERTADRHDVLARPASSRCRHHQPPRASVVCRSASPRRPPGRRRLAGSTQRAQNRRPPRR